jgi:hypothetical protein
VGLPTNGKNDGVEALLRCLTTAKKSGPYLVDIEDGQLKNADEDELKSADPTGSNIAVKSLYELTDPWGNPIAYIHNSEYDKGANVQLASGATAKVPAAKSEVTGQYAELTKFHLVSAGPDGEFGTDDDVTSWGD